MIIYGRKATQVAKELLVEKCTNCGTLNSVELYVFQKYAHVFWIPFFPIGKTGVSQCSHCKQSLKLKEMPDSLQTAYEHIKKQAKTPIWTYSGLGLVAALIIIGFVSDKKKNARNVTLISSPQKGDVYEIKTRENQYTLYKLDEVTADSVFVHPHQYETNTFAGLRDLKNKGETGYSDEIIPFSRKELKQMLDDGEIRDIER